jgi:hypothetical protein
MRAYWAARDRRRRWSPSSFSDEPTEQEIHQEEYFLQRADLVIRRAVIPLAWNMVLGTAIVLPIVAWEWHLSTSPGSLWHVCALGFSCLTAPSLMVAGLAHVIIERSIETTDPSVARRGLWQARASIFVVSLGGALAYVVLSSVALPIAVASGRAFGGALAAWWIGSLGAWAWLSGTIHGDV